MPEQLKGYTPQFRIALPTDHKQIVELEEVTGEFPWSSKHIQDFNKNLNNYIYVALINNIVIGYMFTEKRDDVYHIVKIVSHPKFQQEVWDYMLDKMKQKLPSACQALSICIPDFKEIEQIYFRDQAGFTCTDIKPRMFTKTGENEPRDGYLFEFLAEPERNNDERV